MKLRRPSGLETPCSGPYRYHNPIDNEVESLDRENLPFGCSNWEYELYYDMKTATFDHLTRHYPELTFFWHKVKPKADFVVERKSGWLAANWRTS